MTSGNEQAGMWYSDLRRRINAASALHRPWKIYDECGHEHTDADVTAGRAKDIPDVGYVCEAGHMYDICRECCTDADDHQTEACVDDHYHGKGEPVCSTYTILTGGGR